MVAKIMEALRRFLPERFVIMVFKSVSVLLGEVVFLVGGFLWQVSSQERKSELINNLYSSDRLKLEREWVNKLLLAYFNQSYYRKIARSSTIQEINKQSLWGGEAGLKWHEKHYDRFKEEEQLYGVYKHFIDKIKDLVEKKEIKTVMEIGCGNGLLIAFLTKRYPEVKFTALDINGMVIEKNKERFGDLENLTFIHETTESYFSHFSPSDLTYLVGTGECFYENELLSMLQDLKNKAPKMVFIAFYEPITDFDFNKDFVSKPRGNTVFSHNYPYLLQKVGFVDIQYRLFKSKINPNPLVWDALVTAKAWNNNQQKYR